MGVSVALYHYAYANMVRCYLIIDSYYLQTS